jgi:hypothetical protein
MFIIAYRNNWNGVKVVIDAFNAPKEFSCESEAIDYCEEKSIYPFQIIDVTI